MKKITIHTDVDLTPKGKRRARPIRVKSAMGERTVIRWYVGGRYYRQMELTEENARLSNKWMTS